jgi:hypothetical protein
MRGLLSAPTTDILEIVNKEYNDARTIGSRDHVIGAYYSGVEIVVIVAPTLSELCSLNKVIFSQEKKIYCDYEYRVLTRDIRSYELAELKRLLRVSIRCFNQTYINYINTDNLVQLIINVINGDGSLTEDSCVEFYQKITEKEKTALTDIVKRIGAEGYVSLSTLIPLTGISRPVYNSLFTKLKSDKIAEVNAAGAKGTFIKFLNLEILNLDK